ncbi:MAG: cysteine--tRNA ligase [Parachlamydiales bacterium]|jgi:cysteinyl-tRNA synthetase
MTLKQLHFYNTETRQKELFSTLVPGQVKMYTCGPTVYNYAHIGNFRAYVFEDVLRRTLKYFGYSVNQVMNLTDVDDKTIRGAIAQNCTLDEYVQPFIRAFFEDLAALKIDKVEHYPAATQYIPQMIEMIQKLMDKGMAYKGGDGSIYFPIKQFARYGCLSHLKLDELQAGASQRVSSDEYDKDHLADFVLWKHYDAERDGQIFWDSPFGPGRPGWHLECSTMAMQILGDTLDIHCGGIDNMFPHHENEIAQSEACSGKVFTKLWMHCEHLLVENKKMSKSAGNFYTLRDLLEKGYSGTEVRYMLLHTHYKSQLNFTLPGLDGARSSIARLNAFVRRLIDIAHIDNPKAVKGQLDQLLERAKTDFENSLADDLNMSAALGALYEFVREGNTALDTCTIHPDEARAAIEAFKKFDQVLNVIEFAESDNIPMNLQQLLDERKEVRAQKNWKRSDEIRDEIAANGYNIEDTPLGARLVKKE